MILGLTVNDFWNAAKNDPATLIHYYVGAGVAFGINKFVHKQFKLQNNSWSSLFVNFFSVVSTTVLSYALAPCSVKQITHSSHEKVVKIALIYAAAGALFYCGVKAVYDLDLADKSISALPIIPLIFGAFGPDPATLHTSACLGALVGTIGSYRYI